ncbi:hypothetical protein CNY89_28640, partial [Amaricoccus sp. HAR-UPW-R2A-40]
GVNLLITIVLARTIGPAGMGLVAAALLAVEVIGGRRIAGGVAWTLIANYAVRGVNLLITIVLARTIGPAGMGLVAAALLAVEVI